MESIPKKLLSEYFINNENIKYATFPDEEFQKYLIDDDKITIDILIDGINNLQKSLNIFLEKYSFLIKNNKIGINEYMSQVKMNSIKYIIISELFNIMLKELKNKFLEEKNEIKNTYNFEDIYSKYKNSEYKEILQNQFPEDSGDYLDLKKEIEKKIEYINEIIGKKGKIGIINLYLTVVYLNIYFKKIIDGINIIAEINNLNTKPQENRLLDILVLIIRIPTFPFSLLNAFLLSSEDICNIPEKSKEWEDIRKITFHVKSKEEQKVNKYIENGDETFSYMLSVFNDLNTQKNSVKKVFTALGEGIHLKLNKEAKEIHFKKARLNYGPELFLDAVKFGKNKILKNLKAKTYPSIKFRKKLYLKREFKEINLNYIQELLNFLEGKIDSKGEKKSYDYLIEISEENKAKPLYYEKIEKPEKKNYVSTRLFHNSEIIFKKYKEQEENKSKKFIKNINLFSKNKNKSNDINDTLFIHIHGGAYVGGSTFGHENYLREWSKAMGIPFLGIDYGLSPQHHYPEQINECFQAYMWILKNAKEELSLDIKNIIISGDSAGANIALCLVFLLITINQYENINIKLPDLILMEYPTTYSGIDNITNSLILSLTDLLFDPIILRFARDSYVGDYQNMNDPFLNPIKANEKILKFLPKTRFFFGSRDPLRDDSIRMLYPISKIPGLDVIGYELYKYWHSFNSPNPKELRKMPWDLIFAEVDEFLKSQHIKEDNKDQ